jgi:hypothetical protein
MVEDLSNLVQVVQGLCTIGSCMELSGGLALLFAGTAAWRFDRPRLGAILLGCLIKMQLSNPGRVCVRKYPEVHMSDAPQLQVKEHMDVISSDRKTVGKVDHLEGSDRIKLTKQSSPDGQHHHFIPISWVDHVDQHVHLNKTGADVTAHWQHEGRG